MMHQLPEGHPLRKKNLVGLATWKQWMEKWRAADTAEELVGLLHVGFDVPYGNDLEGGGLVDRTTFYLNVAHGYNYPSIFPGDRNYTCSALLKEDRRVPLSNLCGMVAEKAWKMICLRVLDSMSGNWRDWKTAKALCRMAEDKPFFGALANFFSEVDNLPGWANKDHEAEICRRFLHNMVWLGWGYEQIKMSSTNQWFPSGSETEEFLVTIRPSLLKISNQLGLWKLFLADGWWQKLSVKDTEMVKKLALSWTDSDGKKGRSIAEAMHAGSKTAFFYHTLTALQQEEKRQKEEAEAVRRKEEAEREIRAAQPMS